MCAKLSFLNCKGGELQDLVKILDELDKNDGKVDLMAQPAVQVIFTDEQVGHQKKILF